MHPSDLGRVATFNHWGLHYSVASEGCPHLRQHGPHPGLTLSHFRFCFWHSTCCDLQWSVHAWFPVPLPPKLWTPWEQDLIYLLRNCPPSTWATSATKWALIKELINNCWINEWMSKGVSEWIDEWHVILGFDLARTGYVTSGKETVSSTPPPTLCGTVIVEP